MANTFGAVEVPIPVSSDPNMAVGDPALWYLASFVKDVLNANSRAAWQSVAQDMPVRFAFAHDPEKADAKDAQFPAVFVWREGSNPERVADDYLMDKALFEVLWVFPPATQRRQAAREPFFNAVIKPLMAAFEQGRHPAWKLTGDTTTYVATRGSLIWKACGFQRQVVRRPMTSGLSVQLYEGGKLRDYDAIKLSIEAEERLTRDPTVGAVPTKLDGSVTSGSLSLDVSKT